MMAGIPFGIGIELTFISLLNYLTDAYSTVAASANASATISRSILGVLLPLASPRMYATLGVQWATTLLALLSLMLAVSPFLFITYGNQIRRSSRLSRRPAPRELQAHQLTDGRGTDIEEQIRR